MTFGGEVGQSLRYSWKRRHLTQGYKQSEIGDGDREDSRQRELFHPKRTSRKLSNSLTQA